MSKPIRVMKYAVVRRWEDNPRDFQVLEYFSTKKECAEYIASHPHHQTDCKLEIAKWK